MHFLWSTGPAQETLPSLVTQSVSQPPATLGLHLIVRSSGLICPEECRRSSGRRWVCRRHFERESRAHGPKTTTVVVFRSSLMVGETREDPTSWLKQTLFYLNADMEGGKKRKHIYKSATVFSPPVIRLLLGRYLCGGMWCGGREMAGGERSRAALRVHRQKLSSL